MGTACEICTSSRAAEENSFSSRDTLPQTRAIFYISIETLVSSLEMNPPNLHGGTEAGLDDSGRSNESMICVLPSLESASRRRSVLKKKAIEKFQDTMENLERELNTVWRRNGQLEAELAALKERHVHENASSAPVPMTRLTLQDAYRSTVANTCTAILPNTDTPVMTKDTVSMGNTTTNHLNQTMKYATFNAIKSRNQTTIPTYDDNIKSRLRGKPTLGIRDSLSDSASADTEDEHDALALAFSTTKAVSNKHPRTAKEGKDKDVDLPVARPTKMPGSNRRLRSATDGTHDEVEQHTGSKKEASSTRRVTAFNNKKDEEIQLPLTQPSTFLSFNRRSQAHGGSKDENVELADTQAIEWPSTKEGHETEKHRNGEDVKFPDTPLITLASSDERLKTKNNGKGNDDLYVPLPTRRSSRRSKN
ncbi:hypothetical protein B0J11DRAFT_512876 [Dendryphion nanum]|uniref:Uncharacterized protein n=1 Tax=Dendryphion nanum TaxID=256645 RepID=A0A9P9CYM4_9PLEO|nr:hypothetical protein B0J11DRAFT_512876 [Dendryphion nanum]